MLYSSAGLLALIIHLIIHHDMFRPDRGREIVPAQRSYYAFLYAVMVYYISDICWGLLYERQLIALTFLDTAVYFLAMAASILLWTQYVVDYLKEENVFGKALKTIGWLLFIFQVAMILLNFFVPVFFSFDEAGVYHAEEVRHFTLGFQVLMFVMTAVYAFVVAARSKGTMRFRHRTIGMFSLAMAGFITGQMYFPLFPLYAIGCLLGSCVLHSFVLENEKEEYRDRLEEKLRENILKGNYYDLLTGLPGMSYFFELAEKKRTEMRKEGGKPAFLFMDLSGMKFYNQKHGFAEGDRLLKAFAELLIAAFGSDNCSRFGQDHFVVFTEEEGLREKLDRIFEEWRLSWGRECPAIRAGIYPDQMEHVDITTACDRAKAARDSIRNSFVSAISYFDTAMLVKAERQQYIISHLDRAIEENWIRVYYHPIIRAASGRVCDEEALARWIDPERGFLSPAEFIPVLEEAGLVYKLDLFVVDQVLLKMHKLEESGLVLVPQSVNLSRSDFDSCDMVEEICRRVDRAGIPHSMLSIEITESIVGSDLDFIKKQIDRFRALGFPVWMDDFGSGYSSLDVLANIDVDLIKFDMRFIQELEHAGSELEHENTGFGNSDIESDHDVKEFGRGEKEKIILTELMRMVIGLGIDTVCEGVEWEDQLEFLRYIGCARLQGFYYARPMPAEEILNRYEKGIQIGFENPMETEYYETIGKVNLYDLDTIAREEKESFRNYYSTLPMAIIEVRGDTSRFTRSNQAYRDFMDQTFGIKLAGLDDSFKETPQGPGHSFVVMLRRCCREGGRTVFDETMPDGRVIHSFVRRVAENPYTGTTAAAVAVLSITV